MLVFLFMALIVMSVGLVQSVLLAPLDALHLPHLPFWLTWAIGLVVLSWFMGE